MHMEIKMFILTRILFTIYGRESKVMKELEELFGKSPYWRLWRERYPQIEASKALQVMLMRDAGFTYRKIANTLNISQAKISEIIKTHELKYEPLPHGASIEEKFRQFEERMTEGGLLELW